MCIQQFIKIFHIVADQRLFPYIRLDVASVSENWHLANLLVRVCRYQSGPSCSKLTTSLFNDSLKFTSSDTQICWNILLKKCECKSYSQIFQQKVSEYWVLKSAKTVNEMTLNEVVKLTMLWTAGSCMRNIIIVFLRFQELWVFSLTIIFWPWHCLGQGKLEFGNSFVYTKVYQNIPHGWRPMAISIFSHFASALPWSMKSGIWQADWLDRFGIYQNAKNYQNIPNGLSAMPIYAKWPW